MVMILDNYLLDEITENKQDIPQYLTFVHIRRFFIRHFDTS